ncbi:hypothetical protein BMS3Abin16_00426 [archaeon BMS3Abin16]|nr:hypothetical protein BMS3Abin16_00426 [archaeon BMS3Abin16]
MRFIAAVILIFLFLAPQASAIERFELEGNVSLIVTSPRPTYYILTLVNKNDFNITLVENIQVNFTHPIDHTMVSAVDNYNKTVVPDAIGERSITVTYNNTLPALGYGKIFVSLDRPPAEPKPTTTSTTSTTSTSTSTTLSTSTTTTVLQRLTTTSTTVKTLPLVTPAPVSHTETPAPSESIDEGGALPVQTFLVLTLPVILVLLVILNHFLPSEKISEEEDSDSVEKQDKAQE